MRKKSIFAAAVIIAVLTAGVMISRRKMPYKNLKAANIVSAAVHLAPPDRTLQITDTEIEELVPYLNEIVIYNEDNSYTDYCGQAVMFTLTMADGSQEEITAYNPFVIINGIGYKTKYEPCEQLGRYANQLLNTR